MPEIITPELVYQTVRRINSEFAGCDPEFTLQDRTIKFNLPDRGVKKTTFRKIIELAKQNNLISKKGVKILKKRKEYFTFKCGKCNQGININKYREYDFIRKILYMLNERPKPIDHLDHQPLIPFFTVIRAAAIYEMDSLYNKRIICIGDFDSTALALSVLAHPKEIVLVDIDTRLIKFFNEQAKKHNLPIKTIKHDLTKPLPVKLRNRFDIFITDPPYTVKGMKIFIDRGISALKKGGKGYIASPFHENLPWTGELSYEIQRLVTLKNCIITDVLKNFHEYKTADGLTSSLIRIKKDMRCKTIDKKSFYWWKDGINKQNKPEVKVKSLR